MLDFLMNPLVIAELRRAWKDSQPDDPINRHEEGGYVLLNLDTVYAVERWPRGIQAQIVPQPLDAAGLYNGRIVVATFHTHPNPPVDEAGREWEQGPSFSDRRWHQRRGLQAIVISGAVVFAIDVSGNVSTIGPHAEVLSS